ncbi:MAG: DUF1549 and DUF1553 domain-containing protein [Planctomycetota bacterium]
MRMPSPLPRARAAMVSLALAVPATAQMDANFEQRLQHWAWQPLRDTPTPQVAAPSHVADPLDAFVLSRLEQDGLQPAPPAPPEVWLRRVHFDLTGLPPRPRDVAEFAADSSRAQRERVVDALLASPHFGERWARHWLDLVRYAESMGHEFDFRIPNAWRYRDYVIRALNDDVPFDQFGKEHLAGDLLPTPRVDPASQRNESVLGTGFYWFCEQTHSPVDAEQHRADRIDNQIDVLTKSFLGVTVACARCHDHKFDAIGNEDYYALYGFLKSSRYVQQPLHRQDQGAVQRALAAHRALAGSCPENGEPLDASLAGYRSVGDADNVSPLRAAFVHEVLQDEVRLRYLPGTWLSTAAIARERDCVLLSPTFVPTTKFLHLEVAGHGARVQLVVDGFHLVRDPIYGRLRAAIDNQEPHWITIELEQFRARSMHLQFLDQRAHDLADPAHDRGTYPDDAWCAVRRVVSSEDRTPPPLVGPSVVTSLARSDAAVAEALRQWQHATAALAPCATAPGMADSTGEDERVFERGDHKTKGAVARRRFLRAIAGSAPMDVQDGSGRLQLAERVFADDNPLPPRVLVNRLWHHLFGRGLARTVDNLGHLGDEPLHKDLLDHLARAFVASGWSQKHMIRRIVLSTTYAMDSRGEPGSEERDPDNLLWHRQNLRRLEGEVVRDALLAIADRLDPTLFGPPVPVRFPKEERARGRPEASGPVDGDGRRSIYLAVPRNFLPDLLVAFDLPRPFSTVGARTSANVPAQALALQNDPLVHSMARLAADHLLQDGIRDDDSAVERWFVAMFARAPSHDERAVCRTFLHDMRRELGCDATDPRPYTDLAHVLWNKKEFVYLR